MTGKPRLQRGQATKSSPYHFSGGAPTVWPPRYLWQELSQFLVVGFVASAFVLWSHFIAIQVVLDAKVTATLHMGLLLLQMPLLRGAWVRYGRKRFRRMKGNLAGEQEPGKATNVFFDDRRDAALNIWLLYSWSSAAQEFVALAVVFCVAFTITKAAVTDDTLGARWTLLTLTPTWIWLYFQVGNCFEHLDGGPPIFPGSKWLRSKDLGVSLYIQEGCLKKGESTDPVILKHEPEAIVCDGENLCINRVVLFGPKGMRFPKPLILEFAAGSHETVIHKEGEEDWHTCPDADTTVFYRGLSRHVRVRVHHFSAYAVAERVVVEHTKFWSNRKVVVTNISTTMQDDMLCIVYPYRWVEKHWTALSSKLASSGVELSASAKAELISNLHKDRELKRQVLTIGLQASFSIPKEQGGNVSLVLARLTATEATVFAEMNVKVGNEVTVNMSKLTRVLPYNTVRIGDDLLFRVTRTLKDPTNVDPDDIPAKDNVAALPDTGNAAAGASCFPYSWLVPMVVVVVIGVVPAVMKVNLHTPQ